MFVIAQNIKQSLTQKNSHYIFLYYKTKQSLGMKHALRMHTLFHLVLLGYLLGNWVPPTFLAQCLCVILTNSIHTTMWQLRYTMLTSVNCLIFSNHASTCNTHP